MESYGDYEYKIIHVVESGLSTLIFGAAGVPLREMENQLNSHGMHGWRVVFQVIERRRYFLFWQRDAIIITLARSRQLQAPGARLAGRHA